VDLVEIWDFIADDSDVNADAFMENIAGKLALLAAQPGMGRQRGELLAELRSFPIGRYVVFYLPTSDGIEVVRVLHNARDLNAHSFEADT
jgi:toxin ParE1/3/4